MPVLINGILQSKHYAAGLSLEEQTDDFLMLLDPKGYTIACFTQYAMPVEIIRIADNYIDCAGEFKND